MVTKQCYIHYSLDVVLCLPLHVYVRVENILKHVLFYMHDVKVMAEKIGVSIKKLLENILFYPILGQTKIRKLLLTELETKHNVTVFWHHVIQLFTRKTRGCNILFNSANKKIISVFSIPVICWQEMPVAIKKDILPLFISVNALLFSMQYGLASFLCVL